MVSLVLTDSSQLTADGFEKLPDQIMCAEVTGSVAINGHPRNLGQFRKLSRYIMQEDLLQPHITVQEAMLIAASLKLGDLLSKEKKLVVIEEILDMLRLMKARNTVTSRLSGGERKRLSIALELVNNPPVIFLDEPTTESGNPFWGETLSTPDRESNLDLPVIGSLVYCESSALNHAATEAAAKPLRGRLPDLNSDNTFLGRLPDPYGDNTILGRLTDLNSDNTILGRLPDLSCDSTIMGRLPDLNSDNTILGRLTDPYGDNTILGRLTDPYGLDDLSSYQCIALLKKLAQGGRTVICSIHTPSARMFAQFDHVYIVSSGQCVFQGQGSDMVPFLSSLGLPCPKHYNPADFVIEVSSGEYGDHTEKMVAAVDNGRCYRWSSTPSVPINIDSPSCSDDIISESSDKPDFQRADISEKIYTFDSSTWAQFRILTYRMLLQSWRNPNYLSLKVGLYVFLILIVSMLFWRMGNDGSKTLFNFGFVYTCVIVFLYVPMLPILLQFPNEVQLLKREYFNRWYSLNAYFFALTIARLPLELLLGTMYLACVYITTGQPLEVVRYLQFLIICLLTAISSESLGFAISSTLSVVNSTFVGPAMAVPLMLLAVYGLGGESTNIPLYIKPFMYMSYLRYALEGLVIATYGNNRAALICPDEEVYCHFKHPKTLLQETGMEKANIWVAITGLVVFYIIFRSIFYFLLRRRLSMKRSFAALNIVGRFVKSYFTTGHV
uniref:Uncharacterized protein n=1 Tax=Timema tahoe TaxID=61484 RepID=A0A7R9FHZ7_9NEOP|nr:unnamed protein product [Timema tahoe]